MLDVITAEREFPRRVYLKARPVGKRRSCCKCAQMFHPTSRRQISCELCFESNSRADEGSIPQMMVHRPRPKATGS